MLQNDIMQENDRLNFGGPPPDREGLPLSNGCEAFVGKWQRDASLFLLASLDELYRDYSSIGLIHELRLMMEFSGFNQGFGIVEFFNKAEATQTIELTNDYELRPRLCISVVKSVDNCRPFVGNLPKDKSSNEIKSEMVRLTEGVKECIVYSSIADKTKDRGFAFFEYVDHRAAFKVRRKLIPERLHMWGNEIVVDWAAPEPKIDEQIRTKATFLNVRNLPLTTTEQVFSELFNQVADGKVQRVKILRDFAFVNFLSGDVAEETMKKFNDLRFNGTIIEVTWVQPDRETNKVSVDNLSSADSGRSSSYGSRPSRKTCEISLSCVSPRTSDCKPPHSSPLGSNQKKLQQFHLPPPAIQSLNLVQHPGSNTQSLPPPSPIQLQNGVGPSNLAVSAFPSVQQQTLDCIVTKDGEENNKHCIGPIRRVGNGFNSIRSAFVMIAVYLLYFIQTCEADAIQHRYDGWGRRTCEPEETFWIRTENDWTSWFMAYVLSIPRHIIQFLVTGVFMELSICFIHLDRIFYGLLAALVPYVGDLVAGWIMEVIRWTINNGVWKVTADWSYFGWDSFRFIMFLTMGFMIYSACILALTFRIFRKLSQWSPRFKRLVQFRW